MNKLVHYSLHGHRACCESENETENSNRPINSVSQTGRPSLRNESICKADLLWMANVINSKDQSVHEYYLATCFSPNVPITIDDFMNTYK